MGQPPAPPRPRGLLPLVVGVGIRHFHQGRGVPFGKLPKDGIPELFIRFGDCEAAYHSKCYTFRNGEIKLVGDFPSGHSSLFTCPDRSAFLAHMGYGQILEYAMEDGALSDGQELLAEGETMNYIQPEEVVPGAEYIDTFYTTRGEYSLYPGDQPQPSGEQALRLPICDWDDGPAPTGDSTETARDAILAVLEGEAGLYGVSGDHYNGDTGPVT